MWLWRGRGGAVEEMGEGGVGRDGLGLGEMIHQAGEKAGTWSRLDRLRKGTSATRRWRQHLTREAEPE